MTASEFEYRTNLNKTITITGYTGDDTNIVVPSEIDGLAVTSIDVGAFYGCTGLKSVTIPDSVTKIGEGVFCGCTGLKSVTIPDSVKSIGAWAFCDCTGLTSVTIPDSVTTIDAGAFYGCTGLKSVTIPDSVTTIDVGAFYGCTGLKSVTIPDSVTKIGDGAFYGCTGLKTKKSNYKAFDLVNNQIVCRDYIFSENEWAVPVENIEMCKQGYHFCTNLFEIFNHYDGVLDKDIAIYECEVGDKVIKSDTSKCVTNTIKPVRRLFRSDIIKILNGQENENDSKRI